jgi:hypothetical protein
MLDAYLGFASDWTYEVRPTSQEKTAAMEAMAHRFGEWEGWEIMDTWRFLFLSFFIMLKWKDHRPSLYFVFSIALENGPFIDEKYDNLPSYQMVVFQFAT